MIVRLRGEILESGSGRAVIESAGVGYEVFVPESVLVQLPPVGSEATLFVRQVFREDGQHLYGFVSQQQRRLFDLLTNVKGCGPKTALALIGELGESAVAAAIAGQDGRTLAKATGVGPRLAERMIVELRDQISAEGLGASGSVARAAVVLPSDSEVVEALLTLGYRRPDAEHAAGLVDAADSVEDKIRAALKVLQK